MTTQDLLFLLSEAAVEIANLDAPDNPVAKRVRAGMEELEKQANELLTGKE